MGPRTVQVEHVTSGAAAAAPAGADACSMHSKAFQDVSDTAISFLLLPCKYTYLVMFGAGNKSTLI